MPNFMQIRPGFSLVEMLIVIGMMALFAGFASSVSVPMIRHAEFDRVRETVRNELVAAQADTIAGTLDSSWGVAFFSNAVTRYKGGSYASRVTSYDRVTSFDNGVILSGASDIAFNRPSGTPSSTATIVMTSGTLHATTTVSAVGAISIQ